VATAVQWRARWPFPLGPAIAVLGWHRVDIEGGGLAVPPDVFARQMEILAAESGRFPVVDLDAAGSVFASAEHRARGVVLTFDDAWADNHTNALGPLSGHRMPAMLYAPSGLLGRTGYMTHSQLLEMDAGGFSIGAHSRTHPDLTACSAAALDREIRGSKEDLEDLLGKAVTSFAYPAGLVDDRVEAAVAAAGFTTAVTTRPGWWRPGTSALRIPRSFVQDFSDATCRAALAGGLNVLGLLDAIRRVGALRRGEP